MVSTDHIVTGEERASLAALGADVVDMESTAVAEAPGGRPWRSFGPSPTHPGSNCSRQRGRKGCLGGLGALRSSRQALADWAAAVGPRRFF